MTHNLVLSIDTSFTNGVDSPNIGKALKRDAGKNHSEFVLKPDNFAEMRASILKRIEDSVRENGTLDTLRLDGHGWPKNMILPNGYNYNIELSLNDIKKLQEKMGVQIAKKIEYLGCYTMVNLSPDDVKKFRDFSLSLGSEVTGTLGLTNAVNERLISFKDGKVGFFTQGGTQLFSSIRDAFVSTIEYPYLRGIDYSTSWLTCHIGNTQAAGVACQEAIAPAEELNKKIMAMTSPYGKKIIAAYESWTR